MRTALLALTLITLLCPSARAQQPASYDDRHRVTVSGDALVNVAPDRIIVTLGVDTRDINLLIAKQRNDTIVKNALAAMKRLDVPERDIQTDHLSIGQRFKDEVFQGYTVRNMFAVTLNDSAKVEALISTALDAGVNYLLGTDFQTSDLKKYREQARELAVKAARDKADQMAATLGETVGSTIYIVEDQRYGAPSYYSSWSGTGWGNRPGGDSGPSQNTAQVSGGEAADTIALGKVGIRASVRVEFELRR